MDGQTCGHTKCKRYRMVIREYRLLRGEIWDASFSSKLGKAASKLYRQIYGKSPNQRRSKPAHRNFVTSYPCGIIEQAYKQLREQGVPLVGPPTPHVLWLRQMEERRKQREESELREREPQTASPSDPINS
jgi:hypothetical protein